MTKHLPWTALVLCLGAMASASCASQSVVPVMKPTGDKAKAANGRGSVPVMKPTGDEKAAVDPNNPAKPAPK
jgi:hypothetical protein